MWMLGILAFFISIPWIYSNKYTISYIVGIGIVALIVLWILGHDDAVIYLLISYAIFFFGYTKGIYDGKWITKKHLREDIETDGYANLEGMTICNQKKLSNLEDTSDAEVSSDPVIREKILKLIEEQIPDASRTN